MIDFIRYMLISSFCLSAGYLGYLLFIRDKTQPIAQRYYLIAIILFALLLPLSNVHIAVPGSFDRYLYPIRLPESKQGVEMEIPTPTGFSTQVDESVQQPTAPDNVAENGQKSATEKMRLTPIIGLYTLILLLLLAKTLLHLLVLIRLYLLSDKKRVGNIRIIRHKSIRHAFSFFHWIFMPVVSDDKESSKHILIHETIHARHYHSLDILLMELLSAAMWFNPFVWMMRKSLLLVHEFIADEGVLNTGVDRHRYQTLLVNQVSGGKFLPLSSGFHHSLTKKRLIMMTKLKPDRNSKVRILTLIPMIVVLFVGVTVLKGQVTSSKTTQQTTSSGMKANVQASEKKPTRAENKTINESIKKAALYSEAEYELLRKDRIFIVCEDRQLSKKEYTSIKPEEVVSRSLSRTINDTTQGEKVRDLLNKLELLDKYQRGSFNEILIIKLNKKLEPKFASWFTPKCYDSIIVKEVGCIMVRDKRIVSREDYLSIPAENVKAITFIPPDERNRFSEYFKRHQYENKSQEYLTDMDKNDLILLITVKE